MITWREIEEFRRNVYRTKVATYISLASTVSWLMPTSLVNEFIVGGMWFEKVKVLV